MVLLPARPSRALLTLTALALLVPAAAAATPSAPTTQAAPAQLRTSRSTLATADFRTSGFALQDRPGLRQTYFLEKAPLRPPPREGRATDPDGVRRFVSGGRAYDHPLVQAQWGISNLNSLRATGKGVFLARARANAQRLVAARVAHRTPEGLAWFFPFPFDFPLHSGRADTLRTPWFSAMAQGEALALFTRLAEVETRAYRKRQWRTAARAAYRSFLVQPGRDRPWVAHVDSAGLLWLDEYPVPGRPGRSDLTFNGHAFALFGLYDYWAVTKDPGAARLVDGALTTALRIWPRIRNRGWISSYCLLHPGERDPKYHRIHVAQLRALHRLTAHPGFARAARTLDADYPNPAVTGTAVLRPGRVTAYRFDAAGRVTARRTLRITRASRVRVASRFRVRGRAVHLRLSAGRLAGYAVPHDPARVTFRANVLR